MSTVWNHIARLLPGHDGGSAVTEVEAGKRKSSKYIPGAQIKDPEEIHDLLKLAAGQRTQTQLDLYHERKRYSFVCHSMYIAKDGLGLVYETDSTRIPLVAGLKVTVYCQIRQFGKMLFYAFPGAIKDVKRESDDSPFWNIDFDWPEFLECRQRRATLRAVPGQENVKRIMLWELPPVRGHVSPSIKEWGKPLLAFLTDKTNQISIKDISATGIRLRVPQNEVYLRSTEFTSGKHYALLLSIDALGGAGEENFLLIIRIQNQKLSEDLHFFDFGAQYVAISPPPRDSAHEIQWRVLGSGDMVEKLAKWITNLTLEELRKAKANDWE